MNMLYTEAGVSEIDVFYFEDYVKRMERKIVSASVCVCVGGGGGGVRER